MSSLTTADAVWIGIGCVAALGLLVWFLLRMASSSQRGAIVAANSELEEELVKTRKQLTVNLAEAMSLIQQELDVGFAGQQGGKGGTGGTGGKGGRGAGGEPGEPGKPGKHGKPGGSA